MAKIILTDDHTLVRSGLAKLIQNLGYHILFEASNGKDFIEQLDVNNLPDLVLMDINMPEMDGFETTMWLKKNHPAVKVLALSMYDNELSIIRMLQCGAKGYILKDSNPRELQAALDSVINKGFYYSGLVNGKLVYSINTSDIANPDLKKILQLNKKEADFLKYVCTEFTYKEIADKLNVSHRTIDNYRDALFEKLLVKTRVGLVMFAIKNGIVHF